MAEVSAISYELSTVEPGKGYWIYTANAATLTLAGQLVESSAIQLYAGWNLTGYTGEDGKGVDQAVSSIDGKWSAIWNWTDGQWSAEFFMFTDAPIQPLNSLYQGKAYWIKMKQAGEWQQ